jgi:hypothetical protein
MLIGGAVATIYCTESPSVTRDAAQQKLKKLKQKY